MERDHRKISYECSDYESVDIRSLFWAISQNSMESRTQEKSKGIWALGTYYLLLGCKYAHFVLKNLFYCNK